MARPFSWEGELMAHTPPLSTTALGVSSVRLALKRSLQSCSARSNQMALQAALAEVISRLAEIDQKLTRVLEGQQNSWPSSTAEKTYVSRQQ